ncbi:MAG: putative NADH-quinone oxidoreductase, subunit [Nitrospira sp.]|jgi:NADH-quinone oxidoreductase subunit M|nr:putative NADH-quinone oxidoreductase, subunit [Nitrospira sp.]
MIQSWLAPWLLVAVPCLGAALGLFMRSSPRRMKNWALVTTVASLLSVAGLSVSGTKSLVGLPLLCLIPLAAFLSLLGQPPHPNNRMAWMATLGLMGLGLAILTGQEPARTILVVTLLGLLCGLLYRYQGGTRPEPWRGLATYGLGTMAAMLSIILPAPASAVSLLVTCATMLPLLPLHGGFVAILTGLPGNLPAFLALLLPVVGFHTLCLLLPNLDGTVLHTTAILALTGACYGSLRALIQSRPLHRLAYAGLAFFCILWWYIADTGTAPVQASLYLSAVGLAMSGLLLAWYAIRARYGDIDVRAIGGLAYPMPRFSTLLALLALAALGMPPFAVFSGFMGMLFHPAFVPSGTFAIIMVVWLSASWYFIELVEQLIFGPQRPNLRYEDLRGTEFASLLTLVLLLLALGTAPSRYFETVPADLPSSLAMTGATWSR